MGAWTFSIRKVISIVRGTYNAHKFQTRRTSGLRSHRTIASKYAFNNLELRTGSPTRSVVTRVRSSASDQYSLRSHWTLNPRNVNSMFAVNGWFMLRGSHIAAAMRSIAAAMRSIAAAMRSIAAAMRSIAAAMRSIVVYQVVRNTEANTVSLCSLVPRPSPTPVFHCFQY